MGCAAIIVASGSSRRMGFDKLAAEIRGKPVLAHTVQAFMAAREITRVIVVELPKDSGLTHLDTAITMLDAATFSVYPYLGASRAFTWQIGIGLVFVLAALVQQLGRSK